MATKKRTASSTASAIRDRPVKRAKTRPLKQDNSESAEPCPPQKKGLTFLDLPPEIRNEIYSLAVIERNELGNKKPVEAMEDIDAPISFAYEPELARVNRQIRHEVLSLFYGKNNFRFGLYGFQVQPVIRWLSLMQPEYSMLIPGLELALHCDFNESDFEEILPLPQKFLVASKQATCFMQAKEKSLSPNVKIKIHGCFVPHYKTFLSACKFIGELRRKGVKWSAVRQAVTAASKVEKARTSDYIVL